VRQLQGTVRNMANGMMRCDFVCRHNPAGQSYGSPEALPLPSFPATSLHRNERFMQ
jgi:hypothetical protein